MLPAAPIHHFRHWFARGGQSFQSSLRVGQAFPATAFLGDRPEDRLRMEGLSRRQKVCCASSLMGDGQGGAFPEGAVQKGDIRRIGLQPPECIGAGQERAGDGESCVFQEGLKRHANERLVFDDHATGFGHRARSLIVQEVEEPRRSGEPTGLSLEVMESRTIPSNLPDADNSLTYAG